MLPIILHDARLLHVFGKYHMILVTETVAKGDLEMHWSWNGRTPSGFLIRNAKICRLCIRNLNHVSPVDAYSRQPYIAFQRFQYVFDIRSMTRAPDWSGEWFAFHWVICSVLCFACLPWSTYLYFSEFWSRSMIFLLAQDLRLVGGVIRISLSCLPCFMFCMLASIHLSLFFRVLKSIHNFSACPRSEIDRGIESVLFGALLQVC